MLRGGFVVGAIVGLLAVAAHLLKKHTAQQLAEKSAEIRRWEDDGGHDPSVDPSQASQDFR